MADAALADLLRLSVPERIQLVQDLWDSLAAEPGALPISEAEREELRRRSDAHRRSPGEAVPLDDALERIDRSLG